MKPRISTSTVNMFVKMSACAIVILMFILDDVLFCPVCPVCPVCPNVVNDEFDDNGRESDCDEDEDDAVDVDGTDETSAETPRAVRLFAMFECVANTIDA